MSMTAPARTTMNGIKPKASGSQRSERRAPVAVLNRRPATSGPATTRSRGLLALDVAGLPDEAQPRPLADRALDGARRLVGEERYGPFSLVWASPGRCWMMSHPGDGS